MIYNQLFSIAQTQAKMYLKSVLFFVLLNCIHSTLSKEHHDGKKGYEKSSLRRKHINYKHCPPMKCAVICPIEVMSQNCDGRPPYQPGGPILPYPSVPIESSTPPSTEGISANGPSTAPNQGNQTGSIFSQVANNVDQALPAISNFLGNKTDQSERHHLKHRKKHTQFKKLTLANRNGKRSYKFRQMSQCCFVKCKGTGDLDQSVIHEDPGIVFNQPPNNVEGGDNEVDEADDDEPYVEGEDAPIEVTRDPGSQSRREVDFIGLDDFGFDGLPAKQFPNEVEGKKKTGKKN